jgi:predicted dehydrogenase
VPVRLQGNWDLLNYMEPFARQSVGPRLFVDAILEDRNLEPDFYDGLKVQEVIDAAVESHERGVWMAVSELGS